jgi:hypothetical protein
MHFGKLVGLAASALMLAAPLQQCEGGPMPPVTTLPPVTTVPEPVCTTIPRTDQSRIPNGDFNEGYVDAANPGAPATQAQRQYAPDPWGINASPDLSTETNISFDQVLGVARTGLPGFDPSPVGGSFMGFRSLGPGFFEEGLYNTLDIPDASKEITIFFYYTEYTRGNRASTPPPADPVVNIEFRLDIDPTAREVPFTGVAIASVDNLVSTGGTPGTWEERRITFTPADLGFGSGTYNFYLGSQGSALETWAFVDGLVVVETEEICEEPPTTVVEPTTTTLFEPTTTTFVEPTTTIIGN